MNRAALAALHAALAVLAASVGMAGPTGAASGAATPAPLFTGFDTAPFPIDSSSPPARRYFGQGLQLAFGFNPAEAARSFEAATTSDPSCAACWWGLAWSLGPNINTDMDAPAVAAVDRALQQARRHAGRASALQRALIEALAVRHPGRGALDEVAYAQRMQVLARRYPQDGFVALLAAEALMNLHPYDWWEPGGTARPWTPEIEALLQQAMARQPQLAGAHHYWIHLQESSSQPQRASASADFLRQAVPGSGHLLHMPSHIDMRAGRFEAAIAANQRAIEADARYLAQVDALGAYRVGYVSHNHHFLWAAAGMAGRSALALQAAQAAWPAACRPGGRDPSMAIAQHYAVLPLMTLVRFGQWDTLLRDTLPPDSATPYAVAIWHYARGTAFARTGKLKAAAGELERLQQAAADPALDSFKLKNLNPASTLVRMAALTLRADLAQARKDAPAAVALLREATRLEDGLQYDEPHLWLAPSRHALGAALLAVGQAAQAEAVYRRDLAHYPDNGWSLNGLALALAAQGQSAQAQATAERARVAWQGADRVPVGSRF